MEWIKKLNEAMDYIEEHLTKDISYDELAKIACCSTYHFQRMFVYLSGVTVSEYIRRRKMSLAAVDLQNGGKVIDVALKYGYQSPTAFNRAFQSIQGVAPSYVKDSHVSLKSFPPISFNMMIKGAEEMNYRIEKKDEFRIIGVSEPLHKELEKNFEIVPKMWQKASMGGTIQALLKKMNSQPMGILGVSVCNEEDGWRYLIAVSSKDAIDDSLEEYIVPASTWAIFTGNGATEGIQELEKRIVTEWLPSSGYEYANAPDIEVYLGSDSQNMDYEVWIPVRKND